MRWPLIVAALFLIACSGINGKDGKDGTTPQDYMLQFCPGYTGAYPGPLPEYGQCLNGVIYATCWDGHNAWTCQVYPGHWDSTSTGAPCSFDVQSGCKVVN